MSGAGARFELDHRIHVLTRKEELDGVRVPGKVVVVLDILFATTTMVAALGHGATEVLPVADERAARAAGAARAQGSYVLSGELLAETLPGFAHPARNQLGYLAAEIDNEDGIGGVDAHGGPIRKVVAAGKGVSGEFAYQSASG